VADDPKDSWKKAEAGWEAAKERAGAIPPSSPKRRILYSAPPSREPPPLGGPPPPSPPSAPSAETVLTNEDLRHYGYRAAQSGGERPAENTTVSEELPETADKAIRGFIALFLLGAVLEGWSAWHHDEIPRALEYWGVGVLLAAVGVWWVRIRTWAGPKFSATAIAVATDFRSWVVAVLLIFAFLAISPFVERREWPFSQWANTPTADEIGAAVAKALPKSQPPATPDEIAAAVVRTLPKQLPSSPSAAPSDEAFNQLRIARDNALRDADFLRATLGQKSKWLHLDNAQYFRIIKSMTDGMPDSVFNCMGSLAIRTEDSVEARKAAEIWGEIQYPIFYAGWRFGQMHKSYYPPGFSIIVGAEQGHARECGIRLKDLLDGLNVRPATFHVDSSSPDLAACKNECIEVIIGNVESP
jgi:hypothetical protein